jgi:omega-6 fatty acid desaturase (delta-12 desaturase)
MKQETLDFKRYRARDLKALTYLLLPVTLAVAGIYLSLSPVSLKWFAGQLLLGIFFFQCFILLHETGHQSFFSTQALNRVAGHVFGLLSFIPFRSWVEIHNLHHRWTGWRDKDPTTEGTVSPAYGPVLRILVNLCWLLGFPLFTIAYRLGNYWNPSKLKRYISNRELMPAFINMMIILLLFAGLIIFFGSFMLHTIALSYLLGMMISDLFILSQHSHIEIPVAGTEQVSPLRYTEQVKYSRSLGINSIISEWIFFNFNLHELHHAYPGIPAYHLHRLKAATPNKIPFIKYLLKSKRMSGMKFIFSTSKTNLNEGS